MKKLIPAIIERIRAGLVTPPADPAPVSRQHQQLNDFFTTEPFGCNINQAKELVSILVPGYAYIPVAPPKPQLYQVYFCTGHQLPWVSIHEVGTRTLGFASLDLQFIEYSQDCERAATVREIDSLIKTLEAASPQDFMKWILKNFSALPDDLLNAMLE